MSRKSKHSELFNSNGCLSRQAIEMHISGQLSDSEKHAVQAHASSCEICSDALEGASLMKSAQGYSKRIDQMHQSAWRRSQSSGGKSRRLYYGLSSVAASLILLFGLFLIFRMDKIFRNGVDELKVPNVVVVQEKREDSLQERNKIMYKKPESEAYVSKSQSQKDQMISEEKQPSFIEESGSKDNEIATSNSLDEKGLAIVDDDIDISEEEMDTYEGLQLFAERDEQENIAANNAPQIHSQSKAASPAVSSERRAKKALRTSSSPEQEQYLPERELESTSEESKAGSKSYVIAEVMPMFQGGDLNHFNSYLRDTLIQVLPDSLWQKSIVVSFVVDTDGILKKVKLLTGTGIRSLDKQVIQLVKESAQWTPAMQAGRPVESEQQLRVVLDSLKNRGN